MHQGQVPYRSDAHLVQDRLAESKGGRAGCEENAKLLIQEHCARSLLHRRDLPIQPMRLRNLSKLHLIGCCAD